MRRNFLAGASSRALFGQTLDKSRNYHWSNNNCVTISCEALEKAGINVFDEGTYKPMNALKQIVDEYGEPAGAGKNQIADEIHKKYPGYAIIVDGVRYY